MTKLATSALLLSLALGARAQAPPTPPPVATGSVTGRMTCSDTQHAARFGTVMLVPTDSLTDNGDNNGGRGRYSARTDLDGNFVVAAVPVGDYYVTGSATGYIAQFTVLQTAAAAGAAALQAVASRFPVLHVSQGGASTTSLTIDRGAVIAGKLVWDDGTPATGITVTSITTASLKNTSQRPRNGFNPGGFDGGFGGSSTSTTDDRGQFRLTGLQAGEYLVRATVVAPAPVVPQQGRGGFARSVGITLYAPGKVRTADATAIVLSAGEEHDDIPFVLDLRALHTVSGRATTSGGDGKVSSGTVTLTDTVDTTLSRSAAIADDGTFTLTYVPAGTYTMNVPFATSGAAQPAPAGRQRGRPANSFQSFQQTLTVTDTDLTGVPVTLTPTTGQ